MAATGPGKPCRRLPPHRKPAVLGDAVLGDGLVGSGTFGPRQGRSRVLRLVPSPIRRIANVGHICRA